MRIAPPAPHGCNTVLLREAVQGVQYNGADGLADLRKVMRKRFERICIDIGALNIYNNYGGSGVARAQLSYGEH